MASNDFRLQEGSAAIDSGSQSVDAIVVKDMDGLIRANYGTIDIGAFEFAGAGSFNPVPAAPTGLRIVSSP